MRCRRLILAVVSAPLVLGVATPASASMKVVPKSNAAPARDAASSPFKGAFSLRNGTGVTIRYQVRWGDGEWQRKILESGYTLTHRHPLDASQRAPTPYVRFDRFGGDSAYTEKEYRMEFRAVGPRGGTAKPYAFRYAADGRNLDIKSQ